MIVTIHQPGYLPWLGFFDKMSRADCFVMLDDAQYEKNYFDNRNKIKTANGWMYLTVPVRVSLGQKLNEALIDNGQRWAERHLKALAVNYKKAPYFAEHEKFLQETYARGWEKIIDLNMHFIKYAARQFEFKTKIIQSSELNTAGVKTDRLLDICQKLKADTYLSGRFGRNYLEEEKFDAAGIKVLYQDFHHPVYRQLFNGFEPGMAALDLLFNHGPESRRILNNE